MMTKEASFRGHSTPHSLRDSSKAPLGHQLQGAEVAGASEEDMGISPEKFIAYSVVRTKATLQELAKSLFRNKKRLPKQKLGKISRSKSYILLRITLPTYQNMWAIILQLLLLRQAIHRLLGLSSHRHHHCNLLIPEASSQKGTSTPNSNVNSKRNPKLVQSTVLCQNQSTYTERYPASEILLCSMSFFFLIRNKQCKFSFNFLYQNGIYLLHRFTKLKSYEAQKSFLWECRAKITKLQKVVPKGAQRKFCAQKDVPKGMQS
jgi:hypothetical protein